MSDEKKVRVHAVLTPNNDDGAPRILEGDNMATFLPELYKVMQEAGKGWVNVWVDGERLKLSTLRVGFVLQSVDGKLKYEMGQSESLVFTDDGLFEFRI